MKLQLNKVQYKLIPKKENYSKIWRLCKSLPFETQLFVIKGIRVSPLDSISVSFFFWEMERIQG